MTIEHKLAESNKERDWSNNIIFSLIGLTGMYIFGGQIIYKTLEIAQELNQAHQPLAEFYQNNKDMFLKADINAVFFGLNVINTYMGFFHKYYKHQISEENE